MKLRCARDIFLYCEKIRRIKIGKLQSGEDEISVEGCQDTPASCGYSKTWGQINKEEAKVKP